MRFLDLEGGSQKELYLFLLLLLESVLLGPKIPKAFLTRSGVQQNFAYTFCADIAHRSTVSNFSLIFKLMNN